MYQVMRRHTLLLICALMTQTLAHAFNQGITLNYKNAQLSTIFKEIEKQTKFDFIYPSDELYSKRISISVVNESIETVMEFCLKGLPFSYSISDNRIIVKKKSLPTEVTQHASTQNEISGKVINEKGEPIAGATVTVKGTNISTATGPDGFFKIVGADIKALLVISSIGYEVQTIRVTEKNRVIQLHVTAQEMKEVTVSTGYQDIPKERATGSFTKIDNNTLNQQAGLNILKRLDGVTSGVQFDNKEQGDRKLNFRVRGLSTINGPQDPLIIVNNFPYEGSINNLNPNDIESITILKDAAAASIWGARAGNGVVVITTKKAKFNQPLRVQGSVNLTVMEKPDLFSIPQMSSSDFIDVEQFLYGKGAYFIPIIYSQFLKTPLSPALEVFIKKNNGEISSLDSANLINSYKKNDIRNEFDKYFYQRAVTQQYSINIQGGNGNIGYLISGGYDRDINELDAKYNRVTLRVENSYKPIKNLQIGLGIYYTSEKSTNGKPKFGSIRMGASNIPYFKFADEAGIPLALATVLKESYTDTAGGGKLLDWKYYPLEDYKYNSTVSKTQNVLGNFRINYTIRSGIDVDIKYQYEKQQVNTDDIQSIKSFATRHLINLFSSIDPSTGIVKRVIPLGGIYKFKKDELEAHNFRSQLNINKSWGRHQISSTAGFEIRQSKSTSNSNIAYGYNEDNLTYSPSIDFANTYPTFVTGQMERVQNNISFDRKTYRFVSLFTNIAYVLNQRYIVSASFRKDASNLFGVNTNNKWKPLWSTGLAWNISNESFYKSTLIPYLKLRATYGYSGNVDPNRSAVTVVQYSSSNNFNSNLPYAQLVQLKNPDLQWEKVSTLNLGLDFSSRNNVISGSFELYYKHGSDLYGPSPIDYTGGLINSGNQIVKNVADMKGKGFDITIQSKNINRSVKWNTTFLINYNTDKITNYYTPAGIQNSSFFIRSGNDIGPLVGKPLYSLISYKWAGLDEAGNPQGYLNDGKISKQYSDIIYAEGNSKQLPSNIVYSGPGSPKIFGSIYNEILWRGFYLNFNIKYQLGYFVRKPSISYESLINTGAGHSDFAKRWQKPGDEKYTNVPSFTYPNDALRDQFYLLSEATVIKGDHIRFQFLNLGYEFDKKRWPKLPFSSLRFHMNLANLGIIWRANDEKLDPDFLGSIPTPKTVSFGINVEF